MASTAAKSELCDVVKKEFREYQTYKAEDKKDEESHEKKRRLQYSYWKYAEGLLDIKQTTDKSSEQCKKMISGLRNHAFHSICKKCNNKNSIKNIDIIYSILFSLIIVHGTYVLVWNVLLIKQSTSIKLSNEDEKRTMR